MTRELQLRVDRLDGGSATETVRIRRMYNLGSATRDPGTAVAHQEEVALSGIHIALEVPAPRIYPIGLHALTTDDELFVQSAESSGEVEIVLLVGRELWIGVGSDHTDRALETVSIPGSKQACANHLAPVVWRWAEIRDHWESCRLRAWVDGRLYQEVGVDAFLPPETILALLRERADGVPEQDFLVFCGTIASVDKRLGFGHSWRYELAAPATGRSIGSGYRVTDVLAEIRPDYRVPFFNPGPAGSRRPARREI